MMNKKDSLNFLQSCIDRIANASEEDIEMFRMKYDMHCKMDYYFVGLNIKNSQENGNAAFAA